MGIPSSAPTPRPSRAVRRARTARRPRLRRGSIRSSCPRGFPVVSVNLSAAMLGELAAKAERHGVKVDCVQANLCRLGCFPDGSFQYALSMFSTLGMIRGAEPARRALAEAHRILKPGGRMALHAHNVWLNLRDPQGRFWLMGQAFQMLEGRESAIEG